MKAINLGVRFLLELSALVALGYWGFTTGDGLAARIGLGIGAPLTAAIIWGTFVAPKARNRLADPLRHVPELLVFGSAVAALFATGHGVLAWVFTGLVVGHIVLMYVFGQRES